MLLLAAPLPAAGMVQTLFGGGQYKVAAQLEPPKFSDATNITVPVESYVLDAHLTICGPPAGNNTTAWPQSPSVSLGGTSIWEFNYTNCGRMGLQQAFSDGAACMTKTMGPGQYYGFSNVRLPKNALVDDVTASVSCSGPDKVLPVLNITGTANWDELGESVAGAGDLNGDGYDDFIIGVPYFDITMTDMGQAQIFFGGPGLDSTPDLLLNGTNQGDSFGFSVAGAGDLNNDGFDDVIVGAPLNDTAGIVEAGAAFIFFGGSPMDSQPDIVCYGGAAYDRFGSSVAGAGDIDNNNYDEVIVGAPYNDSGGNFDDDYGRAYIIYGGPQMDAYPDVTLSGTNLTDNFGWSVAGVGDVTGDGFPDVAVGLPGCDQGGQDTGAVHVFNGGGAMDSLADKILNGQATADEFGTCVAGAGDVNGDGLDDIAVGAPSGDGLTGTDTGAAYIYFGGQAINSTCDIKFYGNATYNYFGISVASAGDLNRDGCDDLLVGEAYSNSGGTDAGAAQVFYGGRPMDTKNDFLLRSTQIYEQFGWCVAGVGDVTGDGFLDFMVGGNHNWTGGSWAGRASLYSQVSGIYKPRLKVNTTRVWNETAYLNGTRTSANFAPDLNNYLRNATATATDLYGNSYVDVPFCVSASSDGCMTVSNLTIRYSYNATTNNFSSQLNWYVVNHKGEAGADGNLSVPIVVSAKSAGNLTLANLSLTIDEAPRLMRPIPDHQMDENTVAVKLVDLYDYFLDDYDGMLRLRFSTVVLSNSSHVQVFVDEDRYITVDAITGPENDNWTGVVDLFVQATDGRGLRRDSNQFSVIVANVNQEPIILSVPPASGSVGAEYVYQITAVDGDGDSLTYGLDYGPLNTTIDSRNGRLSWVPAHSGRVNFSVSVTDGKATAHQNFTVLVPGHQPRFGSTPPSTAYAGSEYNYTPVATDEDVDNLTYSLGFGPGGMSINSSSGLVQWTPTATGIYDVSLAVTDGTYTVWQNYTITVDTRTNRPPRFAAFPRLNATVGLQFTYDVVARDDDGDPLTYRIRNNPDGMVIDTNTGRLFWTPSDRQKGRATIIVGVGDGRGGTVEQSLVIDVSELAKPRCWILYPTGGKGVGGRITVRGAAVMGSLALRYIEVRVDGGQWMVARGSDNWSVELETRGLPDGNHFVEARAYDGLTYSTEARVDFSVSNAQAGAAGVYTLPLVVIAVLVAVTAGILVAVRRKRTAGPDSTAGPAHRQEEATPPSQGHRAPITAAERAPASVSGYATGYSVLPGHVKPGYSNQVVATQEYAPIPYDSELPFVSASRMARDETTGAPYTEADRWGGSTVETGEEPAAPWQAPEEGVPGPSHYAEEPGATEAVDSGAPARAPVIVPKKKMPPPRPRADETVAPAFRCPSCGTAVPVEGRMCRKCDAQDVVRKLEIVAAELERGGMMVPLIHEGIQEAKRALVDMNYEGAKAYAEKAAGKAPIIKERYVKYREAISEAKQLLDKAGGKGQSIDDAEASVLLAESFARKGKYGKASRYARKACSLMSGKEVEPRGSEKDED